MGRHQVGSFQWDQRWQFILTDKEFPSDCTFLDRHKVLITHGAKGRHNDIFILDPRSTISRKVMLFGVFTEGSEIISLSAGGNGFLVGESESFALFEYSRVFSMSSGGVASVRFGGFDVRGIEEYFFSNIHFTFCYY